jgi:hypothetical protein
VRDPLLSEEIIDEIAYRLIDLGPASMNPIHPEGNALEEPPAAPEKRLSRRNPLY